MHPKNQQIKTQQEEIRQWEEVICATPDKLREDAEWFRIQTRHCGNPNCNRCDRFTRAALILDAQSGRMEAQVSKTTTPTTDTVLAAVEKLRDLSLMSGPEGSYYRQAFAAVEAELTRLRARVGELDADLAALVPLVRFALNVTDTGDEEDEAARAVLAKLDAEVPRG